MTHRLLHRVSGLLVLAGAFACSLAVDTSEIDEGCGDGMKLCEGTCVRASDPAYGCTPVGCEPCTDDDGEFLAPTLVPECRGNVCVKKTCAFGWGCDDCMKRLLTDEANCGECGVPCPGDTTCVRGTCVAPGVGGAGGGAGAGGTESETTD